MKEYDISLLTDVIQYNRFRYFACKNGVFYDENIEYERILKARYNKLSRIHKRLVYLFSRYEFIWFCTFTFNNHYIDTSDRTKRDLIKSVLNTHDFKYILNVDYGKTTEREHYHCILATNQDFNVNQFIQAYYPCHCLALKCRCDFTDYKRLSKYINKLANHCVKSTTKRQRIYYNFKGYDIIDSPRLATFYYHIDKDLLFPVE